MDVQLYPFLNFDTGWVWVVNTMPQLLYHSEKVRVPHVQEAGCALELVKPIVNPYTDKEMQKHR